MYRFPPTYGAKKAANMLAVWEIATHLPLKFSGESELIVAFIRGQGVKVVPIVKNIGSRNRKLAVNCKNVNEVAVSVSHMATATLFPNLSPTLPIKTPRNAEPANVKEPKTPIRKLLNP